MELTEQQEQQKFEDDIRATARIMWPMDQYAGARFLDGREHDALFETEECIHLIEATVSRAKKKAEDDCNKLRTATSRLQKQRQDKAIQCWFVTQNEPTAEQRQAAQKIMPSINCLSFSQYQGKLIDVRAYLQARDSYAFGSVRDPITGTYDKDIEYLPIGLYEDLTGKMTNVSDMADALRAGQQFVILGDYGAGKSMTLRQIYRKLRAEHYQGNKMFPIYINLRDHSGQDNAAEILERHGRNVGFVTPSHLVRAWRAGLAILLLDGFDEVSGMGFQGLWRKLHEARYRSMQGVRALVQGTPSSTAIVIAGRAHYFDDSAERRRALGTRDSVIEASLSEFTNAQVEDYLNRHGYQGVIPPWVPNRPLLLGYLVSKRLIGDLLEVDLSVSDPSKGWDLLLSKISEREAQIEAGIDGPTVRRILERLATAARRSVDGLGPIDVDVLTIAFSEICGYSPDEKGLLLLQRLPGLGVESGSSTARKFIDEQFADACRSGDVCAFISTPYNFNLDVFNEIETSIDLLGVGMLVDSISNLKNYSGLITAALERLTTKNGNNAVKADIARASFELEIDIDTDVFVQGVLVRELELAESEANYSRLVFNDCFIPRLQLPVRIFVNKHPHFNGCMIGEVLGVVSEQDIPQHLLDGKCVVDKYPDSLMTTAGLLGANIPRQMRVLLTILKKLYIQSGGGRKYSAFVRGIDHQDARYVDDLLRVLQTLKFAMRSNRSRSDVWLPDRSKTDRVKQILAAPMTSEDELVKRVLEIQQ